MEVEIKPLPLQVQPIPNIADSILAKIAARSSGQDVKLEESKLEESKGIPVFETAAPALNIQQVLDRPTNPKHFPADLIFAVLKLKGMDTQQADQALVMLREIW